MAVARYDEVVTFYADDFSAVAAVLSELLGPVPGRSVLDVARGPARATRELARRGAIATGVALSTALLARAEPKAVNDLRV